MIIQKYNHACLVIRIGSHSVVIDPGNLSQDLVIPTDVTALVITHEHADHFHPPTIQKIIDRNPDAVVIAHSSVTQKLSPNISTKSVSMNDEITVGSFHLKFYGQTHAEIHSTIPRISNLGVAINDSLYYPGDSFTVPDDFSVDTLALPVCAPWMKLSEGMNFLNKVSPQFAFPTHDAILSEAGKNIVDTLVAQFAKSHGCTYSRITDEISREIK